MKTTLQKMPNDSELSSMAVKAYLGNARKNLDAMEAAAVVLTAHLKKQRSKDD